MMPMRFKMLWTDPFDCLHEDDESHERDWSERVSAQSDNFDSELWEAFDDVRADSRDVTVADYAAAWRLLDSATDQQLAALDRLMLARFRSLYSSAERTAWNHMVEFCEDRLKRVK